MNLWSPALRRCPGAIQVIGVSHDDSAPISSSSFGVIALTVPTVPTGMKTGLNRAVMGRKDASTPKLEGSLRISKLILMNIAGVFFCKCGFQ